MGIEFIRQHTVILVMVEKLQKGHHQTILHNGYLSNLNFLLEHALERYIGQLPNLKSLV